MFSHLFIPRDEAIVFDEEVKTASLKTACRF
jgi:hypothetical protein